MEGTAVFLDIVSCVSFTTAPYTMWATARVETTYVSFVKLQSSVLVQAICSRLHMPFPQLFWVGDVQVSVGCNESQCHGVTVFKLQRTPQLWTQLYNDALTVDVFLSTFQVAYGHFVLPVGFTATGSSHWRTGGSFIDWLREARV